MLKENLGRKPTDRRPGRGVNEGGEANGITAEKERFMTLPEWVMIKDQTRKNEHKKMKGNP